MAYLVSDIVAMSDHDLAQFMVKHRRPDGGYEIQVEDLDKISKEERVEVAKRLKKAQHEALGSSHDINPFSLDLDLLDARLRDVSSNVTGDLDRPTPKSDGESTPGTSFFDWGEYDRGEEIHAYHELCKDGGRPAYGVELINDVMNDPDDFLALLRPWELEGPAKRHLALTHQLNRWKSFRLWQKDNRGIKDGSFEDFVEERKLSYERSGAGEWFATRGQSWLEEIWSDELYRREDRQYRNIEPDCEEFDDFCQTVNQRLARHGFEHIVSLSEDPRKQDKLTTWMEYLNFELWYLECYKESFKRLQPQNDAAWQELVSLDLLQPHETQDWCRSLSFAGGRGQEERDAAQTVERYTAEATEVYEMTQNYPERFEQETRIEMLEDAMNKLGPAQDRLERIRGRNKAIVVFVRKTFDFADKVKKLARQEPLIQWVKDQIPAIEAEMAEEQATSTESRGVKRKSSESCDDRDERTAGGSPKKLKSEPLSSNEDDQGATSLPSAKEASPKPQHSICEASPTDLSSTADQEQEKVEKEGIETGTSLSHDISEPAKSVISDSESTDEADTTKA